MSRIMFKLATAAVATLLVAGVSSARADALNDIQSRGKVLIAIDTGSPPFAVNNAQHQPEGADVDVARLLAKDLGVEVEFVPVTGPNRVPVLQTGKADLVIASFSITPERARSVNFSIPHGALKLVVWAPKSVKIASIDDLAGKRIGVTRGGIQDTDVTAMAPKGTSIVRFDTDATVTAAMLAGQIDAMATADHLAAVIAERNPAKELEGKFTIRNSYYAIGVRQGEFNLLQWVNTWIQFHKQSGKLGAVYKQWMKSDLPELPVF
jgi:polar amino acid transport system substrate-binding protein